MYESLAAFMAALNVNLLSALNRYYSYYIINLVIYIKCVLSFIYGSQNHYIYVFLYTYIFTRTVMQCKILFKKKEWLHG